MQEGKGVGGEESPCHVVDTMPPICRAPQWTIKEITGWPGKVAVKKRVLLSGRMICVDNRLQG